MISYLLTTEKRSTIISPVLQSFQAPFKTLFLLSEECQLPPLIAALMLVTLSDFVTSAVN